MTGTIDQIDDIRPWQQNIATAGQTDFEFVFPVLVPGVVTNSATGQTDLGVKVNGVEKFVGAGGDQWILLTHRIPTAPLPTESDGTGIIQFNTPLNVNDEVTLYRVQPFNRTTKYPTQLTPGSVLEDDFDRTTLMVQQNKEGLTRSLKSQITRSSPGEIGFDVLDLTDGQIMRWSDSLQLWVNAALSGGGGVDTFLALLDTPSSYAGSGLFVVQVNAAETGLQFAQVSGLFDPLVNNITWGDGTSGITWTFDISGLNAIMQALPDFGFFFQNLNGDQHSVAIDRDIFFIPRVDGDIATPATGRSAFFWDDAAKRFKSKDDAAVVQEFAYLTDVVGGFDPGAQDDIIWGTGTDNRQLWTANIQDSAASIGYRMTVGILLDDGAEIVTFEDNSGVAASVARVLTGGLQPWKILLNGWLDLIGTPRGIAAAGIERITFGLGSTVFTNQPISAGGQPILAVLDPTDPQEAATKNYVDTNIPPTPSFLDLTDTPADYVGEAGSVVTVTIGEDGLEFTSAAGVGDMLKSEYDIDNNSFVDNAEAVRDEFLKNSVSTIPALFAVTFAGFDIGTDRPNVELSNPASVGVAVDFPIGVVETVVSNTIPGIVVRVGEIGNIDTSAFAVDDLLFVQDDGSLNNTPPAAPSKQWVIGQVARSNITNGVISIFRAVVVFQIGDLRDVEITSPVEGDQLFFNASTSLWENQRKFVKTIPLLPGGTLAAAGTGLGDYRYFIPEDIDLLVLTQAHLMSGDGTGVTGNTELQILLDNTTNMLSTTALITSPNNHSNKGTGVTGVGSTVVQFTQFLRFDLLQASGLNGMAVELTFEG